MALQLMIDFWVLEELRSRQHERDKSFKSVNRMIERLDLMHTMEMLKDRPEVSDIIACLQESMQEVEAMKVRSLNILCCSNFWLGDQGEMFDKIFVQYQKLIERFKILKAHNRSLQPDTTSKHCHND